MVEVKVLADLDELSRAAAREFLRQAKQAAGEKGLFTVVLSGGSTPRPLYILMANDPSFRNQVPWDKVHFFWGDERPVPPEHPESNYGMAWETLLSKVPVPLENIHRIRAEDPDAGQAAEEYEETLRRFFHLKAGEFPRFDMVLLGLGADGHTASLFPGSEALKEQSHLVKVNWVETLRAYRITMTLPVFNQAAQIVFLVTGQGKAKALRWVLEEKEGKDPLPSQLIRPTRGRVLWLVDRAAASLLSPATHQQ
jgi:6-phosphogluconolactonase